MNGTTSNDAVRLVPVAMPFDLAAEKIAL